MKKNKTIILFVILFSFASLFSYGQGYKSSLLIGVPFSANNHKQYEIDISIKRKIIKGLYIGIGSGYSDIDVPKSSFEYFMFDRREISSFISFQFELNLIEKIKASSMLNAGYAFINYNLSGYDTQTQFTDGFSLKPVLTLVYVLNKNADLGLYYSYSKIYSEFKKPDIVGPNPFINSEISNHALGINITFNFRNN